MGFWLASFICAIGIAGLFYLDRDKSVRTSRALWLPVIWLWIVGSRPVSAWLWIWFGIGGNAGGLDAQLDGSPADALVFLLLIMAGIVVLYQRRSKTKLLLKASVPLLLYFAYCLASCLWSPFSEVAMKRWIKAIGDLVMVLVVLVEPEPAEAIRRLFSRVGFILLPASILLIRYSPLGRGFDEDGNPSNLGVTTNKNTLGLITWVLCLGAIWSLRSIFRNRRQRSRSRRLVARFALVCFGLAILAMAHSATSISCTVLGGGLMFLTSLSWVQRKPARMNTVVFVLALVASLGMAFDLKGAVLQALGRQPDLTGRTEIWKRIIPMAQNSIIGSGFESFWNASAAKLHRITGPEGRMFANLNTAHNGYIDAYLNLGLIGIGLIALIFISGYMRASSAFRRDQDIGALILAYLVTSAVYSVTEAGFRMLTPSWIALLLSIVAAGGLSKGGLRMQAAALIRSRRARLKLQPLAWNSPLAKIEMSPGETPEWRNGDRNASKVNSRRII
jgi:exopolysaccharide production protein ExoQ